MKVAVFPGHVGKDSGAIDPASAGDKLHTIEAVVSGIIAYKTAAFLAQLGIPYTLSIGGFDLRIAETQDCQLGVSIHADVSRTSKTSGYHAIYYQGSMQGKMLAEMLDASMALATIRARAPHPRNDLLILRKTPFPCVILETGFLSNEIDEALLLQEHHQYAIAFAIAHAVRKYIYGQQMFARGIPT